MHKLALGLCILLCAVMLCAVIFTDHSEEPAQPVMADFTFDLPEGYIISDVTETACTILNAEDVAVGGFIATDLKASDLKKNAKGNAFMMYLDQVAPGCEFFSWVGDDPEHPMQYVTQTVTNPDTQERKEYYRILFVKDSVVYDMWFDLALISRDDIKPFHPIAEAE